MEKFARMLLWLAVASILMQIGSMSSARRGYGAVHATHITETVACLRHQEVLLKLDKAGWSDAQREALDSICDFPHFWLKVDIPTYPGFVPVGVLLLAGSLLYCAAKILHHWKKSRIK